MSGRRPGADSRADAFEHRRVCLAASRRQWPRCSISQSSSAAGDLPRHPWRRAMVRRGALALPVRIRAGGAPAPRRLRPQAGPSRGPAPAAWRRRRAPRPVASATSSWLQAQEPSRAAPGPSRLKPEAGPPAAAASSARDRLGGARQGRLGTVDGRRARWRPGGVGARAPRRASEPLADGGQTAARKHRGKRFGCRHRRRAVSSAAARPAGPRPSPSIRTQKKSSQVVHRFGGPSLRGSRSPGRLHPAGEVEAQGRSPPPAPRRAKRGRASGGRPAGAAPSQHGAHRLGDAARRRRRPGAVSSRPASRTEARAAAGALSATVRACSWPAANRASAKEVGAGRPRSARPRSASASPQSSRRDRRHDP